MQYLKQSTETKVVLGPFNDATDFVTPETGITLGAADVAALLKHNSDTVVDISGNTWAAVTDADGYYVLTLTAGNTDTLGRVDVMVSDTSVCTPVRASFEVISADEYEARFGTTAQEVNVTEINGNAASGFLTGTDNLKVDIAKINALAVAGFISGTNVLRADAVSINGSTAAGFLSGTDTLRADAVAINGNTTAADNLSAGALGAVQGTVISGSSTQTVKTNLTTTSNDFYNGRTLVFYSGALAGQATAVVDYSGGTRDLTVVALTAAPSNGDLFVIV